MDLLPWRGRLRPRLGGGIALFVSLIISLGLAAPASAQSNPAEAHYRTGQAYYQRGAYADAIREFERAYALSKKPELLYNIGQTYERLGDVQRAVEYFERYVKDSASTNEALSHKIRNLRRRLQQTGIRINTKVAGAQVLIDGKPVGTTPLAKPAAVPPGEHKVRVTKAGFAAYSLAVSVVAGSVVTIDAELQPLAGAGRGAERPSAAPVATAGSDPARAAGAGASQPSGRKRLWTWVTLGTAGALFVGGAITGGLALKAAGDAPSADSDRGSRAKTLGAVTDVLLIAGAASAIAGVVLFFYEGRAQPERSAAGRGPLVAPAVGPGYAGVSAAIDF